MCVEERLRRTRLKRWLISCDCFYRNGDQLSIRPDEKQLASVPAPAGLLASGDRDLPQSLTGWKRPDIHLALSRFIRCVGHPMTIRRELTEQFVELRMQERHRFALRSAVHREHGYIKLGLRIEF